MKKSKKINSPDSQVQSSKPFFKAPVVQAKLKIGQANDKYEKEADAMADKVVSNSTGTNAAPVVQKKCDGCEEEAVQRKEGEEEEVQMKPLSSLITPLIQKKGEEEENIQAKSLMMKPKEGGAAASAQLSTQLDSSKGGGSPMPNEVNQSMNNSFGADFSAVRIHTGSKAVQMNQGLNAKAFTNGSNVYFNKGQYNPQSKEGKHLLAHELTHVIQQGAAGRKSTTNSIQRRGLNSNDEIQRKPEEEETSGRTNIIQRELATARPDVAPAAQADLTAAQIQTAIRFNRNRYNVVGTRLIQDIVGTDPTGNWVAADIVAIASIQEEYGLTKDGQVGTITFRFIDTEVRNERLRTTNAHCLTSLNIRRRRENIVPRNNGALMTRQFFMNAQFPAYCNCADFEYRQFIRGHFRHERGGVVTDEGNWFNRVPAGRLNAAWQEDGHTGVPSINFGHRNRSAEGDNRYLNDAGGLDMANGCRYRGNDTPGGNYGGWNAASPTTGDTLDILVQFRGEIRRRGRVVRSKRWTALRRRFTLPA